MSSFFTTPASQRKRKRPGTDISSKGTGRSGKSTQKAPAAKEGRPSKRPLGEDEDISSDSDVDGAGDDLAGAEESEVESLQDETAAEKRLRLAQQYLDNIRAEAGMSSSRHRTNTSDANGWMVNG